MSNGTQLQITNNTNYTIKNQSVVRMAQYYSIEFKLILTKVRTKWSSIIGDYLREETGLQLKYALLTTLVHEKAHAYHHVGKYKESKIWNHFNDADDNIVEGLAEYYTWTFVEDYKNEYPEMKVTYDYMYQCLSGPNIIFQDWISYKYSKEHVRIALQATRRSDINTSIIFINQC